MSFGEIIRSARRRKNWTQEQLAVKLSCTKTAVSKWEANKSIPPLAKFGVLADVLGIMPDALIGGVDRSAWPVPSETETDQLLLKAWQKLSPQQRIQLLQIAEILSG